MFGFLNTDLNNRALIAPVRSFKLNNKDSFRRDNSQDFPPVIILSSINDNSTADTCKNCAKCGKGFKIGTNEAYNIKIKIRLRGILKIFCFCSHANMAASKKAFH